MELDRILKDRSSGQSRIIRMTLDLLEKTNRKSERMEICMKVCEAHKVMVGLRWVLQYCYFLKKILYNLKIFKIKK